MLHSILVLASLLLSSDARKQEKLEVRFGFAESVQVSGTPTERFRLEMVLSAKVRSECSDATEEKMQRFYDRLKSLYGAPESGGGERHLTEQQFRSLGSERVGDLYTLVTPEGVLEGTVMGGIIAVDPHFNDLFRLYLDLRVPGSRAPRNGRTEVIGIKGQHRVGPWSPFQKNGPEGATQERVERFLRTQGVPLEKYRLSYFRSGSETLVVVNYPQAEPPKDPPDLEPSLEARSEDDLPPRWESGVYVLDEEGLTPLIPAHAGDPHWIGQVAVFTPVAEFEVDGARVYSVEEHGEECCAGGPYVESHLFRANPGGRTVSEVGHSQGYPLCLSLFL